MNDDDPGERVISEVASVFGKREAFRIFAEELRPLHREFKLKDIQSILEHYARRLWPDCTVCLQGSAARHVDNRHFSDVDFAISTSSGLGIYEDESEAFCNFLKQHREPTVTMMQDSLDEKKAIELEMHNINVDVAFKDLLNDASLHGPDVLASFTNLYREYSGAVLAARVAKYVFHYAGLKGLDVEFILDGVARQRTDLWENRLADGQGLALFRQSVVEISTYPHKTHGPMQQLESKARSQHGKSTFQYVTRALRKSWKLAERILYFNDRRKGKSKDTLASVEVKCHKGPVCEMAPPNKSGCIRVETGPSKPAIVPPRAREKRAEATSDSVSSGQKAKKQKGVGAGMAERIILIFDDSLYWLEKREQPDDLVAKAFVTVWCTCVDWLIHMETKTPKDQRWAQREMLSNLLELAQNMVDLGVDCADMIRATESSDKIPPPTKTLLLAFLSYLDTEIKKEMNK